MNKKKPKGILKKRNSKTHKRNSVSASNGNNINLTNQKLPENFFENVMEMEMELENEFNYDRMRCLFQLYSAAIQYYSLNEPAKVKPFQNRMENYLTQKDTLKNLSKFNHEQKIGTQFESNNNEKVKNESNSDNNLPIPNYLPKVRGRAKTKFKIKSKEIKKDDIKNQVKEILKDVVILMKIDKKNLRDIINDELLKQKENFLERYQEKKAFMSWNNNRRKTVSVKFGRKNPLFFKSGKFFPKSKKNKNDTSSDIDLSKLQGNEEDFLKLLNEIDGGKSNLNDSDDSSGSIIGDSYKGVESSEEEEEEEEEESEEEEEEEEESEEDSDKKDNEKENDKSINNKSFNKSENEEEINKKNDRKLNKSKDYIINKFKVINEIDEKDEFEQNKKEIKNMKNNIQENIETRNKKINSSKYLPILKLPPAEEEEVKKEIQHTTKKGVVKEKEKKEKKDKMEENNDSSDDEDSEDSEDSENSEDSEDKAKKEKNKIKLVDIIKELDTEQPNTESISVMKKSLDEENAIRKQGLDEEIKKIIGEKLEKIDDLCEGSYIGYVGYDSNFTSTKSLPGVTKKINLEQFPENIQEAFIQIQNKISKFEDSLNRHFYTEMFDNFYIKLKELYDEKYQKYIKVNDEYHSSMKENEFLIDSSDNMSNIEKIQMQNIMDCLKEEQKDQIDEIIDEYNKKINTLKNEFKQNLFKNNVGMQLIEEQLKLDVYTMINNAFY